MTAQEKLLEYTLFDLTNFLAPDIPPTVSVQFGNNPTTFTLGDSSDTITIDVSNTSAQTDASATLNATVSLPVGLTALTMQGVGGSTDWVCNAGTLTCARSAGLNKNASDSILVTVSVASNATLGNSSSAGVVISGGGLASPVSGNDPLIVEASTTTTSANALTLFSSSSQGVPLQATVTSSAGTVNGGTVTFTVVNASSVQIGAATTSPTVTGGYANVFFTVPAGTEPGIYTIQANYIPDSGFEISSDSSHTLAIVTPNIVWVASPGGTTSAFMTNGAAYLSNPEGGPGVAIDSLGNVWSLNKGPSSVAEFTGTGGVTNAGYSSGDSSAATGLAIDSSDQVWVTNADGSISVFSSGGSLISPAAGFADELNSPTGIAIDLSGNVWIADQGTGSVTKLLGAAAPTVPLAKGVVTKAPAAKP
jgi:hypothetical protein